MSQFTQSPDHLIKWRGRSSLAGASWLLPIGCSPLPPCFRQNEPNFSVRISETVQKRTQNEPKRIQLPRAIGPGRLGQAFLLRPAPMNLNDSPAIPSEVMPRLAERTASSIPLNLRRNPGLPWCRKMIKDCESPATVRHSAHHRVSCGAGKTSTSGARRSDWKNYLTCIIIRLSEAWWCRKLAMIELEVLLLAG